MTESEMRSLAELLEARRGCRGFVLSALDVGCRWPVFRGEAPGCEPVFVKLCPPEDARRALRFLTAVGASRLLPRAVLSEALDFRGQAVLCLEWKSAERVNAEDMTDAQADGFLAGCVELSELLARNPDVRIRPEDDPSHQYAELAAYARRHSFLARLIAPLIGIPEDVRTYGDRRLVPIHGDLQPRNYGFDGNRLAAVFDFEALTMGLKCEDATYAFCERLRKSELSASSRRRLVRLFARMAERSPWPRDEWRIAVNHCRLRIAARRLENHPDSAFIVVDIARRDRPLRLLADVLSPR